MDENKNNISTSGGQGIQVGDSNTQNNYYATVVNLALQDGTDLGSVMANLAQPASSSPKRLWNVPYPPNPYFTGREKLLQQLEQTLVSTHGPALTQAQALERQAIVGLGGIGKTQTAIEYAYRHRDKYHAVLWVQADNKAALDVGFSRIATLLELPGRDAQEAEQVREAVKLWLATERHYLLVLDNVDSPDILKEYLPPQLSGHLLLTSRTPYLGRANIYAPLEVPAWSQEEAVIFLLSRTQRNEANVAEKEAAAMLSQELAGLPLALEQAGAYIAEEQARFEDYLTSYRKRRLALLEEHWPETGGYEKTVAVTWALNFDAVKLESKAATELLRVSAFFGSERIPEELLISGAAELGTTLMKALEGVAEDPLLINKLLKPLARYSLIRRDINIHAYDIHRLVQTVIRHKMDEKECRIYAGRALSAVSHTFPSPMKVSSWPLCDRLLPHAVVCVEHIEKYDLVYDLASVKNTLLLNNVGLYLSRRAQYSVAEPLLKQSLSLRQKLLKPNDPAIVVSLSNLGILYSKQGDYRTAEQLLEQGLKIRLESLGSENSETASSFHDLGVVYHSQGKSALAEQLLIQSLITRVKLLGTKHFDVALSLSSIGRLYHSQGKYVYAMSLEKQALRIYQQGPKSEASHIAQCFHHLAETHRDQGNYGEAVRLHLMALETRRNIFGIDSPEVAVSLNNLAGLYRVQGHYLKAETLYNRLVA